MVWAAGLCGCVLGASTQVLWGFQGGTSARQPESLGSISRLTPDGELQSGLEERRGRPGSLAAQRDEY